MNFSTNCHEGITKQVFCCVFCVAHLSEGLSTVNSASFLIQDFSISDTWSRTSSYRHKVCKINSVPHRVPFTAMWNGTGMSTCSRNAFLAMQQKWCNGFSVLQLTLVSTSKLTYYQLVVLYVWLMCDKCRLYCLYWLYWLFAISC